MKHSLNGRSWNSGAKIEYIENNILKITVTENTSENNSRQWEGIIEINEIVHSKGTITFKYPDSFESGFKEILITSDKENDYIILFPVTNSIFAIEKQSDTNFKVINYYGTEIFSKGKIFV